jgi:hypothetical protein
MKGCIMFVECIDEDGNVTDIFRELYVPELQIGINYYNGHTNIIDVAHNDASARRYPQAMTLFDLSDEVKERVFEIYGAHRVLMSRADNAKALLDILNQDEWLLGVKNY